jgi:hypothetical protein
MLDLGRARSVPAPSRGDAESTNTLTEAGTVVGTPAYMPGAGQRRSRSSPC